MISNFISIHDRYLQQHIPKPFSFKVWRESRTAQTVFGVATPQVSARLNDLLAE